MVCDIFDKQNLLTYSTVQYNNYSTHTLALWVLSQRKHHQWKTLLITSQDVDFFFTLACAGGGGPMALAGVELDLFRSNCFKCFCSYAPMTCSPAMEARCRADDGEGLTCLEGVDGRDLRGVARPRAAYVLISSVRGEYSGRGALGILDGVWPGVLAAERACTIFLGV